MKLFTATAQTQGVKPDDFFWCEDGEIVYFGVFRCHDLATQQKCGCFRSMEGLSSGKATTTFKVEDLALRSSDLARMIYKCWERGGWVAPKYRANKAKAEMCGPFTMERARRVAEDLELAALPFDVGDICECAGVKISKRAAVPA